ncbi:MAG: hypothetical protein ABJ000_12430 [Saccharospirillum sp.]|uniref:hypothetical protein n=1 Tax=Saccharospirillum sp. TaxID=2033801 RepID=UPI003299A8FD
MGKSNKKPYDERTDDEKLLSNWKKAVGLFEREDWSASIMRVATSSEIASNIYVRHYLQERHGLPGDFVNSLLKSANGMAGKLRQLITPAAKSLGKWDEIKSIQQKIDSINTHRNEVAHAGKFKNRKDARVVVEHAIEVIGILAPNVKEQVACQAEKLTSKSSRRKKTRG